MALFSAMNAFAGHSTIKLVLENSEIYPGTTHDVTVTVPDAYSQDTPACLYVGLDGILCNAPSVIDSLIGEGEMPVTIGVFLQPGIIRDAEGNVMRYNRSNEFDAIDGRFASFVEKELLPAVLSLRTEDGRKIFLSDRPSDHLIFGLSSGGIAAFAAAWNRPDLFAKVFSGCGTFVPMRGGNEMQAIVRKSEPKALRIYLQDGFSDTWNPLFGSWYEANRMLASALEFAGYDCAFDWAEGGHSVKRSTEIFADVMRWMWRDYPENIVAGTTANDFLSELLSGNGQWSEFPDVILSELPEIRSAIYPDSSLVAHVGNVPNILMQSVLGTKGERLHTQRFYYLHNSGNGLLSVGGMEFDGNGNLWVVTDAGIQVCDQNGRVRGILQIPKTLDVCSARIKIGNGKVIVSDSGKRSYCRMLKVRPATPGLRPESQGQG